MRAPVAGVVLTPRRERARRHVARGGRPAARPRPDRHARAGVRRGSARHRPGAAGPGGAAPGGCPAPAHLRRHASLRWPRSRRQRGRGVAIPVARVGGESRRAAQAEMAAHARVLTDPASAATRLFRGPGPLGPSRLVEAVVMSRIVRSRSCSPACGGRPAARRTTPTSSRRRVTAASPAPPGHRRHVDGRAAARAAVAALRRARRRRLRPIVRASSRRSWPTSGTRVAAGQLLARLESTDQEIALDQAREQARPTPAAGRRGSGRLTTPASSPRPIRSGSSSSYREAELALQKAQRDYDLTRVVAPFGGVVTVADRADPPAGRIRATRSSASPRSPRCSRRSACPRRPRSASGSAPRRRSWAGGASAPRAESCGRARSSTRPAAPARSCSQLVAGARAPPRQQRHRPARRRAPSGGRGARGRRWREGYALVWDDNRTTLRPVTLGGELAGRPGRGRERARRRARRWCGPAP